VFAGQPVAGFTFLLCDFLLEWSEARSGHATVPNGMRILQQDDPHDELLKRPPSRSRIESLAQQRMIAGDAVGIADVSQLWPLLEAAPGGEPAPARKGAAEWRRERIG
jgi:hypothetical protein